MVDEADLGHWNVLWNEKYSQEIYMYDSVRDAMAAALIYCGYDINTDNADEIKQAADALIEQKPLVKAYLTDDVKDSMIQGSGALALVYSGDAVWCMQENEDLGFFVPEEGSNIYFDSIVITATSSKKEMAEQFIVSCLNPKLRRRTSNSSDTLPQTQRFSTFSGMNGQTTLHTMFPKRPLRRALFIAISATRSISITHNGIEFSNKANP